MSRIRSAPRGSRWPALLMVIWLALSHGGSAAAPEDRSEKIPPPPDAAKREAYGYKPLDYQTTFYEAHVGSHAPLQSPNLRRAAGNRADGL